MNEHPDSIDPPSAPSPTLSNAANPTPEASHQRLRTPRNIVAAATAWLPAAVMFVSWLLWREKLPSQVPSHWTGFGGPDRFTDAFVFWVGLFGVAVIGAMGSTLLLFLPSVRTRQRRFAFFILGFLAGLVTGMWLTSAGLSLTSESIEDARLGFGLIAVLCAGAYGFVPYLIADRPVLSFTDELESEEIEPLDIPEHRIVAWSTTFAAPIFGWAAAFSLALGVLVNWPLITGDQGLADWFPIALNATIFVLLVGLARLRVTVDWRGLRVTSALFGVPFKRIKPSRIVSVESAELKASDWGGWGYRFGSDRSAIFLRAGEGLVVRLTSGCLFAVTMKDSATAAALLATVRDQAKAHQLPSTS